VDNKLVKNLQVKYLADVPEFISILAQWTYDAWSQYDPTLTVDRAVGSLMRRLNRDEIPLTFVAIYNSNPIATVTLKQSIPVPGYEDRDLWLGSFWVEEDYRDQGVGQHMLECAYKKARELGYKKISLFASDPEMANWYAQHGWTKFDTAPFHEHTVTLFERFLL
jgi:GNAT superfamily N-acetyltransferase